MTGLGDLGVAPEDSIMTTRTNTICLVVWGSIKPLAYRGGHGFIENLPKKNGALLTDESESKNGSHHSEGQNEGLTDGETFQQPLSLMIFHRPEGQFNGSVFRQTAFWDFSNMCITMLMVIKISWVDDQLLLNIS